MAMNVPVTFNGKPNRRGSNRTNCSKEQQLEQPRDFFIYTEEKPVNNDSLLWIRIASSDTMRRPSHYPSVYETERYELLAKSTTLYEVLFISNQNSSQLHHQSFKATLDTDKQWYL